MKIDELLKLSDSELIKEIQKSTNPDIKVKYADSSKQYNPLAHVVFDETLRPKKTVKKPSGRKDAEGKEIMDTSYVDVARLSVPFQKLIVERAVSFLLNEGVKISNNAESDTELTVVEMINKIYSDNKLDYRTRKIARILFSECEAAELWYIVEDMTIWRKLLAKIKLASVKYKTRVRILANSLGDQLYPHFDPENDMDAFGRYYTVTDGDKAIEKFDLFTQFETRYYTKDGGDWKLEGAPVKNLIGKIPVIYYSQSYPEWHDVQGLIERFEKLISNFADSNDYFGSPMVKVTGKVTGFAEKGEQGKVIQLEQGADADYLTWDQAPDAIKLELETLMNLIYSCTQTPDISFAQMKNLGNLSGVALKLMFLDAHLKVFNKTEIFGECIQRRLNLLKAIIGKVIAVKFEKDAENIEFWPEFAPYLPSNETDLINMLSTATGAKPIMSQRSAVKINPFVDDPDTEMEEIEKEQVNQLGESFDLNMGNKNTNTNDGNI